MSVGDSGPSRPVETGRDEQSGDWLARSLRPSWRTWTLALVSLALVLYGIIDKSWRREQLDLRIYLMGARHLFDGTIYIVKSIEAPHLHFTYTPFAGLFFYPFAHLPFWLTQVFWLALTLACLASVVAVSVHVVRPDLDRRSLGWATVILLGPAFWLEPVEANFHFGQINVLLVLMVLADLTVTVRVGRWRLPRGVLVGVAAAIKLIPLVFVAYLFVTRQTKAAWVAVASFVACSAVAALCNPTVTWQYWTKYALDARRIGDVYYLSNQSMRGSLDRMTHTILSTGVTTALSAIVLVAGLALARWAYVSSSVMLAVLVTAVTGMVVSPITWTHHMVWFIPMLAWLALGSDRPRGGVWWALGVAAVVWSAPMWWVSSNGLDQMRENLPESLAANSYFFVLVGFLVAVAFMLRSRARRSASAEIQGS